MHRILSFGGHVLALAAISGSFGCTSDVQVGNDGSGGAGGSAGTMSGPGGGHSMSSATSSGGGGSGGSVDVSGLGGPCGGNIMSPPKQCAQGLHCVQGSGDAVGTCAEDGQTVSGVGGPCGGTTMVPPPICAWNLQCQSNGNPDAGGTCIDPGAGGGCPGSDITIMDPHNGQPSMELHFACKGSYGAPYTSEANGHVGYEKPISVDPNQKEQVWIDGCLHANAMPQSGSLSIEAPQAVVGSTTTGKAMYYDGIDAYATETDVTLTITSIDATTIRGAFTAHLDPVNNGGAKDISGTFAVCHVVDFFPP